MPELNLFAADTVGELIELDDRELRRTGQPLTYLSGLVRAIAHLEAEFAAHRNATAFAPAIDWIRARPHWTTGEMFDHVRALLGPIVAVDKSPRTVVMAGALERALDYRPDTRVVHLVREPFATTASLLRTARGFEGLPKDDGEAPAAFGAVAFGLHFWAHTHRRIMASTRGLGADRLLRIRAEDVLAAPELWLGRMARWLGHTCGPEEVEAMLHPERSPYANLLLEPAGHDNDIGFLRAPGLRRRPEPAPLSPPAGLDAPGWIVDDAMVLATELGYTLR